jgi:hypothetical protein
MTLTVLTACLAVSLAADPPTIDLSKPHPPHPLAPSLPELTKEEEDKLDEVIDRFALADTGQLKGEEAKAAVRDFNSLGPESTFALIRGLNRAAVAEQSCPTLVIAKKLVRILGNTEDPDLLEFARDNIAAGVEHSQHMKVLQDLRVGCMLRKNALARAAEAGVKSPRSLSTAELAQAASNAKGSQLRSVLTELANRREPEALSALAGVARSADGDARGLARAMLDKGLGRLAAEAVRQKLHDDDAEVRQAAARTVAAKFPALAGDVIDLLTDADADVAAAAHKALTALAGGQDYGPAAGANAKELEAARQKWLAWWEKQSKEK